VAFSTPHDTSATGLGTELLMTFSTVSPAQTFKFTITNLALAFANPSPGADGQIDVAHLGQTTDELAARMDRPLKVPAEDGGSGRNLTFDYIGKNIITDGSVGTYKVSIAGVTLIGGTTASLHTVQSSTLTLATNDVIRGQATVTLAR
jgi:hypothetical protein